MKILLVVFTFFIGFSVNAQGFAPAQRPEKTGGEKEISGLIKFATERLELSGKEAIEFEKVMKKNFEAMKKIDEKYLEKNLAEAAEKDSVEKILKSDLAEILTPEKQKQFERIMRRMSHSHPGPPPQQNGMKPKK